MLGKLENHIQQNEIGTCFIPYTNINSERIKHLNIRYETPKESIGRNLGNDYLDMMSRKAQTTHTKMNKWYYIKLKSFCRAKETK